MHTSPHSATMFHSLLFSKWNSYPLTQDCWPKLWLFPSMYIWHFEYWGVLGIGFAIVLDKFWLLECPSDEMESSVLSSSGSHNDLVALSGGWINYERKCLHSDWNKKYLNIKKLVIKRVDKCRRHIFLTLQLCGVDTA